MSEGFRTFSIMKKEANLKVKTFDGDEDQFAARSKDKERSKRVGGYFRYHMRSFDPAEVGNLYTLSFGNALRAGIF